MSRCLDTYSCQTCFPLWFLFLLCMNSDWWLIYCSVMYNSLLPQPYTDSLKEHSHSWWDLSTEVPQWCPGQWRLGWTAEQLLMGVDCICIYRNSKLAMMYYINCLHNNLWPMFWVGGFIGTRQPHSFSQISFTYLFVFYFFRYFLQTPFPPFIVRESVCKTINGMKWRMLFRLSKCVAL